MKKLLFLAVISIMLFSALAAEEKKVMIMADKDGKQIKINDHSDLPDFIWHGDIDIPGLTDEQQSKIEKIEFDLEKKMIDLNASMMKKDVEIRELLSDNAKLDAVLKKIDEKGKILSDMEKKRMEKFYEVKSLLDKKQQDFLLEIGPSFLMDGGMPGLKMNKKVIIKKLDDMNLDEIDDDEVDD